MLLLLLAPLLTPVARAGEIHVSAPLTLVVHVDDMPCDFEAVSSTCIARNLAGGSYQVEVRTALDKLKAQLLVEVGADEVVALRYSKKTLVETGRGPMPPGGTPERTPETQLRQVAAEVDQAAHQVEDAVEQAIDEVRDVVSGDE